MLIAHPYVFVCACVFVLMQSTIFFGSHTLRSVCIWPNQRLLPKFLQKITTGQIHFTLFAMLLKQNPLPYIARYPEADVLTSSDQVVPTVVDDRLDIWQQGEVCIKASVCYVSHVLTLGCIITSIKALAICTCLMWDLPGDDLHAKHLLWEICVLQ